MIWGDIERWEHEKGAFSAPICRAMDYLKSQDLSKLEIGKYLIEGELMFALVQETATCEKQLRTPESHLCHIDIQYLVSGKEKIGVAQWSPNQPITEDHSAAKDTFLYLDLANETDIVLAPGSFAIFFPADIHRPCCLVQEAEIIKKVVIKIHISLLA